MRKMLCVLMMLSCVSSIASAQNISGNETVTVYFFWSHSCPHCAREMPFLQGLEAEYPWLDVKSLEVSSYRNAELYSRLSEACGQKPLGVPATFIGDEMMVGYDDDEHMGVNIRRKILDCHEKGCPDPLTRLALLNETQECEAGTTVNLPILGYIDASKMSLPLFTVVIGGLDGFNPCAFFVLFFLLSLLIHAQSRLRMFMIGGIFVFFSALIYFIFMTAWLNFFLIIGQLKIITLLAGLIALIVSVINIKDFFWFKKGVSLSIPDSAKPKLFTRMRSLVKATEIHAMVFGTVILAIAANTYELLCTAGFPMVYTRVLTLHNLSKNGYYTYLALYNIVYVIPLLTIVVMFTLTLGSRKLKEEEGRMLKLLSGFMMLSLGLILIIAPGLLNNVLTAVGILAFAVCATAAINSIMKTRGQNEAAGSGKR